MSVCTDTDTHVYYTHDGNSTYYPYYHVGGEIEELKYRYQIGPLYNNNNIYPFIRLFSFDKILRSEFKINFIQLERSKVSDQTKTA